VKYSAGLLVVALLLAAPPAMANKISGSVSEVTDARIVVKKGRQKLDIARDANTRVEGELKKGARVTVEYTMTATDIAVKESKRQARSKKQD
jgi:hypothetical protein